MKNRELSDLEKAFVVRHMHRAEHRGDDPEKAQEDEEVLEGIFQCSPWRFAGLKAEQTKRKLRRQVHPDLLLKRDVPFARSLVGLAGSVREQEVYQGEAADILQVDLSVIQRISGDTRRESKVLIEGLDTEINGEFPLLGLSEVPLLTGGAHADYDTPLRGRVREVWSRAIDQAIPQSLRSKIYGLILPGKRCLDVPHYLKLNIPSRNIIGLENGGEVEPRIALAEFTLKAREYDIDYRTEDLTDFLRHFRQRLAFAVLDFTGQMCPKYMDITANLPLSERAVVIVNSWARRESREYQQELRRMCRYAGLPEEEFTLDDARGLCPGLINAGAGRKENWYFGSAPLEQLPIAPKVRALAIDHPRRKMEKNLETILRPMLGRVVDLINKHGLFQVVQVTEAECEGVANIFWHMFKDVTFGDAYVEKLEKYSYRSEIIGGDNPFHTDIGVIRTPKSLYQGSASRPVDFFMKCAVSCLSLLAREGLGEEDALARFKFAVMRKNTFVEPGDAKKSDRLVCLLDGRMVEYRPIHMFLNAIGDYYAFHKQYPPNHWKSQIGVDRQEIQ